MGYRVSRNKDILQMKASTNPIFDKDERARRWTYLVDAVTFSRQRENVSGAMVSVGKTMNMIGLLITTIIIILLLAIGITIYKEVKAL